MDLQVKAYITGTHTLLKTTKYKTVFCCDPAAEVNTQSTLFCENVLAAVQH